MNEDNCAISETQVIIVGYVKKLQRTIVLMGLVFSGT